jgi:drug/metabolite transporter (DMT)-like permease
MNIITEVLSKLPMMLLLVLAALGVAFGDYFAKLWSMNPNNYWYALALVGYSSVGIFYLPTLLKNGLVITSVIYSILAIVAFLVVGLVVFNETLTARQIAGVSIGIVSLLILSI